MKKLVILFAVSLLFVACASTSPTASKDLSKQPVCRQMPGCSNIGIHDHIVFIW